MELCVQNFRTLKVFEILGHLPYSIFNIRTIPLIRSLLDNPRSGLNSLSLL